MIGQSCPIMTRETTNNAYDLPIILCRITVLHTHVGNTFLSEKALKKLLNWQIFSVMRMSETQECKDPRIIRDVMERIIPIPSLLPTGGTALWRQHIFNQLERVNPEAFCCSGPRWDRGMLSNLTRITMVGTWQNSRSDVSCIMPVSQKWRWQRNAASIHNWVQHILISQFHILSIYYGMHNPNTTVWEVYTTITSWNFQS